MIAREGALGRVFVLRLEDGDRIPDCLEAYASEQNLACAFCLLLGGAGSGNLVVGPKDGAAAAIVPLVQAIADVHELAGVGTLFPDESGRPRLHLHATLGRDGEAMTGCARRGVEVWKIAEAVLVEITGTGLMRKVDPAFGFEVLAPGD